MPDFSNGSAFVDEKFVPISEAKISLLDWGFLHSDATYDVVHVRDGNFFDSMITLIVSFQGWRSCECRFPTLARN